MLRLRPIIATAAVAVLAPILAVPATAQLDPAFNHLKCYKIKGASMVRTLQTDNQFGREKILKLVPQFLCVPTKKTCLNASEQCGTDPVPGVGVPHFTCYKAQVKQCIGGDCSQLTGKFAQVPVTLTDQFGSFSTNAGPPKMLCAPAVKQVAGATTTTTSTSTTTTTLCNNTVGTCDPSMVCNPCGSISTTEGQQFCSWSCTSTGCTASSQCPSGQACNTAGGCCAPCAFNCTNPGGFCP